MKRVYTFYKDSHPGERVAVLTIEETIHSKTGNIEIINRELTPVEIVLAYQYSNNLNGVEVILNDRTVPPNRMFFADYCKERGLNPYDLDDRLSLSKGRSMSDDYYVVTEIIKE